MNKVILDFQSEIMKIYEEHGLACFKGLNREYEIKGKQAVAWYNETTHKGSLAYRENFNFFKNFDDLTFCSDEIMYFLANMYLYRPFLNNPIKDSYFHGGKIVYPNFQNLAALRYSMFANIMCEKIYNFWDRIGDLLNAYFPKLFAPNQVYFGKVIDNIPSDFHNDNYSWLKDFKNNQFSEVNKMRRDAVHYFTEDTEFKHEHIWAFSDKVKVEELVAKRHGLADYFKMHMQLTFDGFEHTMNLIDLITAETL